MKPFAQALDTALQAARAAAAVHQEHLGRVQVQQWSAKGAADFVTHVDRDAEAEIVRIIRRDFPGHSILAEEEVSERADAGSAAPATEWVWLVDPLDGTTNYLHQYPMYSASVALLHHNQPVVGAVTCGATGEEWTALQSGGAFRNGERIRVSSIDRFDRALIATGFPFKKPELLPQYLLQFERILRRASDIRRAGSAALDLCHLASGYFDGFWELDLKPWDYAAGVLIIREAGGIATGLMSEPDWRIGGGIQAGNPHIYAALSVLLRGKNEA